MEQYQAISKIAQLLLLQVVDFKSISSRFCAKWGLANQSHFQVYNWFHAAANYVVYCLVHM